MISATKGPASGIKLVMIPGWPRQPRVELRGDDLDLITVCVTQRYEGERVHLVVLRGGKMMLMATSTRGRRPRKLRVPESELTAVVCVPRSKLGTMQVDISTPRRQNRQ